jgi:hypothetical protein
MSLVICVAAPDSRITAQSHEGIRTPDLQPAAADPTHRVRSQLLVHAVHIVPPAGATQISCLLGYSSDFHDHDNYLSCKRPTLTTGQRPVQRALRPFRRQWRSREMLRGVLQLATSSSASDVRLIPMREYSAGRAEIFAAVPLGVAEERSTHRNIAMANSSLNRVCTVLELLHSAGPRRQPLGRRMMQAIPIPRSQLASRMSQDAGSAAGGRRPDAPSQVTAS